VQAIKGNLERSQTGRELLIVPWAAGVTVEYTGEEGAAVLAAAADAAAAGNH
jgi:hypothetical protein